MGRKWKEIVRGGWREMKEDNLATVKRFVNRPYSKIQNSVSSHSSLKTGSA